MIQYELFGVCEKCITGSTSSTTYPVVYVCVTKRSWFINMYNEYVCSETDDDA